MNCDCVQIIIMLATIVGVVIPGVGVWVSVYSFRKQLRLNFFADYTKRYQEIILNFPENINDKGFNFESMEKHEKDKTLRYMRAYFDLCSEEFFLWKSGNIDEDTWNEWRNGIKYAFSKTAFRQAWKRISLDSDFYTNFNSFIEEVIKKTKN